MAPVTGEQLGNLAPVVGTALIPPEDISGPRITAVFVVTISPDKGGVTVDPDGTAEEILHIAVGCGQLLHLAPVVGTALIPLEDIGGSRIVTGIVIFIRAYDDTVTVNGNGTAEVVVGVAVPRDELLHLAPVIIAAVVAPENVGGTGIETDDIAPGRTDDGGVAADGDGNAEQIPYGAVARGQLFHLAPVVGTAVVALKNISGTGIVAAVVIPRRPDNDGVAADGDGNTERVAGSPVAGGQLGRLAPCRIDSDRVERSAVGDRQEKQRSSGPSTGNVPLFEINTGGQASSPGVPGHKASILQDGVPSVVLKGDNRPSSAPPWMKTPRHGYFNNQVASVKTFIACLGRLQESKALLQAARLIDIPLGNRTAVVLQAVIFRHELAFHDGAQRSFPAPARRCKVDVPITSPHLSGADPDLSRCELRHKTLGAVTSQVG